LALGERQIDSPCDFDDNGGSPCEVFASPTTLGDPSKNPILGQFNLAPVPIGTYSPGTTYAYYQLDFEPVEPPAHIWNGGAEGDDNWTTAANWGGTTPSGNNALQFGPLTTGHATNFNDFDAATQINGITFLTDAPQYNLQGHAIKLAGPVVNQSTQPQEIGLDEVELVSGGGPFDDGGQVLTLAPV
jgi:hypothetical protein